jgi:predicted GTPase
MQNAAPKGGNRRRLVIVGAAGRDFHNFNVVYRDDPSIDVVAFTAAQLPGIAGRHYPPELSGSQYPEGIPIADETELETICRVHSIDEVVFSYSDVPHEQVMHLASRALATGADFRLLGPRRTMLSSALPVIAITAVRTGCGKSPLARWLSRRMRERGLRVAVLRHPMPYGDLVKARVQRFATIADIDAAHCTAEEREEYEPHIAAGNIVFAGVDYAEILRMAELEAQLIVWDGGNNDFSFVRPDLQITVVDALRPRQVATHHPGEAVARMADIIVINKIDAASADDVRVAGEEARAVNPTAIVTHAASPVQLDDASAVRGKRTLVVEDGPTITHGGMSSGAGYRAALAAGAEIVDPRGSAAPELHEVFRSYPHIGKVLPAMGYSPQQLHALAATINNAKVEVVVSGTPLDLASLVPLNKPVIRARYEFVEASSPALSSVVDDFIARFEANEGRS